MWTPSDPFRRGARRLARARRSAAGAAVALALAFGGMLALPAPRAEALVADAPPAAPSQRELRRDIERRYQVSSVHNGVLLKPRVERLGVHEVEVSGDVITVNGARVSPAVLISWVGDGEAAPLLRLLDLAPADRQALFGLSRDVVAGGPGGGASSSAPGSEAPPAAGDEGRERAGTGAAPSAPSASPAPQTPGAPPIPPVPGVPPTPPTPSAPAPADMPPPPAAPAPPPSPPSITEGSQVRFGRPVTVTRNEVADEVTTFGGSIHVEGEVNRDVMAIGGSVRINGRVGGNVEAIGGSVHLGPRAEVMGDVASVGGTVTREPGAVVHGSLSDVGRVLPGMWSGGYDDWDDGWFLGRSIHLFWKLALLILLMLAVSLVVLLAPRLLEEVRERIAREPGTTLVAGILGELLAGPALGAAAVILVITIVGCVLLLLFPFVILALMIAALVGFAAASYQMGRVLEGRFSWRPGSPFLTTMIGVLAIEAPTLVGHLMAIGGGMLHAFALMILFFGALVRYVAWTIGFGAAILTAFANRPDRFRRTPAAPAGFPAPPPAQIGGGLP